MRAPIPAPVPAITTYSDRAAAEASAKAVEPPAGQKAEVYEVEGGFAVRFADLPKPASRPVPPPPPAAS